MKRSFLLLTILFLASFSIAQQGINYKALISDNGEVLQNKSIDVQFSILEEGTKTIYLENHNAVTDKSGIIILNIGEGNAELGDFSKIDWSKEMFLKVEIDTGDGYEDFGTTAFKAVPYAKFAEKAANTFSGNFNDLSNIPLEIADGDDNTQLTEEQVDEFVENNGYIDVEIDGSTNNELQVLTLDGKELKLSHEGGSVTLPDDSDNWGSQSVITNATLKGKGTEEEPLEVVGELTDNQNILNLNLLNDSLTVGIENGESQIVDLSPLKDGTGTDNQNIIGSNLMGTELTIGIENGGSQVIDLSSLKDGTGTDNQNVIGSTLIGTELTIGIERGNSQTVDLSSLQDGTGTDNQNISGSGLNGSVLTIGIENGNSQTVDLSSLQGSDVERLDDLNDAKTDTDGYEIYLGKSAGKNDNEQLNNNNIALGYEALRGSDNPSKNIGYNNIALGYQSLLMNSSGSFNTASGFKSLNNNTTGSSNTALGQGALNQNIAGNGATAVGFNAMANQNNSSISFENHNTAIGYKSLNGVYPLKDNTGNDNTALGYNTLTKNSSGESNIAIGVNTLQANKTGNKNIAIGNSALYNNTVKSSLIAIGDSALYNNGKNSNNYNYSIKNIAIGSKSLIANTVGHSNTAIGFNSMKSNTSGVSNTAVGSSALYSGSIGSQNTGIGDKTLYENKIGFRNTAIGYYAGYKVKGNGNVFIGNKAGYYETGSNKLYIDNSNTSTPLIGGDFTSNIATINGKLGIGTDSPEAKLHIKGDVKVNTTLKTGGNIYSDGSVKVKNDFTYNSSKTYYYQIHPLDFKIKYGDGNVLRHDETGMWIRHGTGSGVYGGEAYAQIRLPQGAVIKNIRYYCKNIDNGSGSGTFIIALFRSNITTPPAIEIMGQKDHFSPTGNVYNPFFMSNISNNTIDNYYYQYILKVFLSETAGTGETDDVSFYGATIEYTLNKVTQ